MLDHLTAYALDQVHSACCRLPENLEARRARDEALAATYDPDSDDVVARSEAMAARARLRLAVGLKPTSMDDVRDAVTRWWPSECSWNELRRFCRKHPGALTQGQLAMCWRYVKQIRQEVRSRGRRCSDPENHGCRETL